MSILKIAKLGHPVLIKKAEEIKEFSTDILKKTIVDMLETMIDYNGIGLAAPQVHISKRIIIFRKLDPANKKEIEFTHLINPYFQAMGDETEDDWEGCLSIPGMQGSVRRFKKIKYGGFNIEGKKIVDEADGMQARVIQHEIDHLEGILYIYKLANKNKFGFEKEITEYIKNEK